MSLFADYQLLDIYFLGLGEWDEAKKMIKFGRSSPRVGDGATVHI